MPKMRALQISKPNGPFELVERDIPQPGPGEVLIKVEACGICHSDSFTKEGSFPNLKYPRIPGHEVAGRIEGVGKEVKTWEKGQRVGVGWYGGHCGICDACRDGDFITCNKGVITGVTRDGGYADYMTASLQALAKIPEEISPIEAAPLMCAGITTFNSLRNSGAKAGDLVAVLGIGGLGHLAVQYATKMGYHTVAIARGKDKEPLAKKLGAKNYIDSQTQKVGEELLKMGGAKVILSTVTNSRAMSEACNGLGREGKLIVLGVDFAPIEVSPMLLVMGRRSVVGWPSGAASDSQDTLAFSGLTGIRPMIEVYPLEKASEAYERMMSGKARFRVVLSHDAK
jgi:D-arabinose 1-dehydrogenase-like Zn-dependent alcohol dehydrogenase